MFSESRMRVTGILAETELQIETVEVKNVTPVPNAWVQEEGMTQW